MRVSKISPTIEDFLKLDLYKPYAEAIKSIKVSQDMSEVIVTLKDGMAPIGALHELEGRLREFGYLGPTCLGERLSEFPSPLVFKFKRPKPEEEIYDL